MLQRLCILAILLGVVFTVPVALNNAFSEEIGGKPLEKKFPRIETLLAKNDFQKVFRMSERLKKAPLDTRLDALGSLAQEFDSKKPTDLKNLADTYVLSDIKAGNAKFDGHGLIVQQDISTRGGLAAWTASQITGLRLPAVGAQMKDQADREVVIKHARDIIKAFIAGVNAAKSASRKGNSRHQNG